jgi:hypothetical protein
MRQKCPISFRMFYHARKQIQISSWEDFWVPNPLLLMNDPTLPTIVYRKYGSPGLFWDLHRNSSTISTTFTRPLPVLEKEDLNYYIGFVGESSYREKMEWRSSARSIFWHYLFYNQNNEISIRLRPIC